MIRTGAPLSSPWSGSKRAQRFGSKKQKLLPTSSAVNMSSRELLLLVEIAFRLAVVNAAAGREAGEP